MPDNASLPRPRWALAPPAPQGVVDALRLPRLWSQLLFNRGIESRETAWDLLHASEAALHDPFLFAEMDVAVARVLTAIEEGEIIAVFGDFDTDGVTASALLYESLLALGCDAFVHLPHRVRDGHGLNAEAVDAIAENGASVIITVDCGITSGEEVRQAKRLGMDVILTDHHAPMGAPPEAFATVTPTSAYPFPFLTGAGLGIQVGAGNSPEAGIACSPGRPGAGIAGDCRGHGSAARGESRHSNAGPREAARDGAPRSARALVGGGRRSRVP